MPYGTVCGLSIHTLSTGCAPARASRSRRSLQGVGLPRTFAEPCVRVLYTCTTRRYWDDTELMLKISQKLRALNLGPGQDPSAAAAAPAAPAADGAASKAKVSRGRARDIGVGACEGRGARGHGLALPCGEGLAGPFAQTGGLQRGDAQSQLRAPHAPICYATAPAQQLILLRPGTHLLPADRQPARRGQVRGRGGGHALRRGGGGRQRAGEQQSAC